MAKSTGPTQGYTKLGELHGIGDHVITAECEAVYREEARRAQAQHVAAYEDETVGKDVPDTTAGRGYTRVG